MIGLDTNVLVRYIVKDDRAQFARARRVIEERLTPEEPGWIGLIVTAELVWALRFHYDYTREEIAGVIERLLYSSDVKFEHEATVARALDLFRQFRIDFADALIALSNEGNGCSSTVSFDQRLVGAGLAVDP